MSHIMKNGRDVPERFGITAFLSVFFVLCGLALSVKISSGISLGDYILGSLGLPVMADSNQRFYFTGFAVILFLIPGIILFRRHFRKSPSRTVINAFLFILIFIIICQPVYNTIYGLLKSQSNGLSSIEYLKKDSSCTYNINSYSEVIKCSCKVSFANYSNKPQNFRVDLHELKEQICLSIKKYTGLEITDDIIGGDQVFTVPSAGKNMFSNAVETQTFFEFSLKFVNKENRENAAGAILMPIIHILPVS